MTTLVVGGPTGLTDHDGGLAHPEQQGRVAAAMHGVRALGLEDEIVYSPIREASVDELSRVHRRAYLAELEAFCARGGGAIDPDTYARPDSWTAARRAAGTALAALDELDQRGEGVAFVPVRPPGHHATGDRAMGFCLLNNVAVAAAARTARGERVAIIDWDVHHGNGTQDIFWNDPHVLYVSTHQHPLFPGTGSADEVGGPAASGLTVNLPLPRGATGNVVRTALEEVAAPAVADFGPDWLLVSCGFDAHRADPLGELMLSSGDFADLASVVSQLAPAPGRLALFLEGGYDSHAVSSSVQATLGTLVGVATKAEAPTSGGPGLAQLAAARADWRRAVARAHREAG